MFLQEQIKDIIIFTAHAIDRDGRSVPYTVQFTAGGAHRLSLRIDHTVDGVAYEEEVLDVLVVAFYPVALRSANSAFADEYVMSVWQRDAGVADPQIVHYLQFYSTSFANAHFRELSPIQPIFVRPSTLRFGEAQICAAVIGLCNYGGLIDTLFTDVEGVA